MFHRRRALSYAPPAPSGGGTGDLNWIGYYQPVTSTSSSYSTISFNSGSMTAGSGTFKSGDKWIIMGVASRDANGEQTPAWSNTFTVSNVNQATTTTAKEIGYQGTASASNSYTSLAFYAWFSSDTRFSGTISLGGTHEGGSAVGFWELDSTDTDLWYDRSFSTNSSITNTTMYVPRKKWSDYPTLTNYTVPSFSRVHAIYGHGTSNAVPGTPTANTYVPTWTRRLELEHGTAEWVEWNDGEVTTIPSTSWTQGGTGAGSSSTTNVTVALTVGVL